MKCVVVMLLASSLCWQAHARKIRPTGLVVYDTNSREGSAYVTDTEFRGLEPHNGSVGIVMFGDSVPIDSESYTAPPHGPLVFSFVHPQSRKPATVTRVSFWVLRPLIVFNREDTDPVPIKFLDPHGRVVATQATAAVEFPVSVHGVGPIASIQVGDFDYPRYVMVSDLRFDGPRVVHASESALTDTQQIQRPAHVLDFESGPNNTPMTGSLSNEWQQLGVVFSDSVGNPANIYETTGLYFATRSGTNGIGAEDQTLVVTFVQPTTGRPGVVVEAGIWVINSGPLSQAPTTIQFFDAKGKLLETMTTVGKYFFAGARSKSGIARIVLTDPDRFVADDLEFGTVRRTK